MLLPNGLSILQLVISRKKIIIYTSFRYDKMFKKEHLCFNKS